MKILRFLRAGSNLVIFLEQRFLLLLLHVDLNVLALYLPRDFSHALVSMSGARLVYLLRSRQILVDDFLLHLLLNAPWGGL